MALANVNVDEQPGLAVRFEISAIPTILFVRDGRIVGRVLGAYPKATLGRRGGRHDRGARPPSSPVT